MPTAMPASDTDSDAETLTLNGTWGITTDAGGNHVEVPSEAYFRLPVSVLSPPCQSAYLFATMRFFHWDACWIGAPTVYLERYCACEKKWVWSLHGRGVGKHVWASTFDSI
jgi:hypothetical protein